MFYARDFIFARNKIDKEGKISPVATISNEFVRKKLYEQEII